MTELLYLAGTGSGYLREFAARVTALPPGGVVLDRTLFYAVGGGQPADHGVLRRGDGTEWKVVDVARSGTAVVHRLDRHALQRALPRIGEELTGTIDWGRRFDHMRCHTAQHLLSARIFSRTGLRTRHAEFGKGEGRIELDGPWPGASPFGEARADFDEWVRAGRPVTIRFLSRAEYDRDPAARSGLVPLPPHVDPVRVIEIEGLDRCPCGGTHLRSTGEIGPVELLPPVARPDGTAELRFHLGRGAPPTPTG